MNGEAMVEDRTNPTTGEAQLAIVRALRTGRVRASDSNPPPGGLSKTDEEMPKAVPSTTAKNIQDSDSEKEHGS